MLELPFTALSIRQPWAWAIIYAGKDIENRTTFAVTKGGMTPRRIAVHAAKGLKRNEYDIAAEFMKKIGVVCPPACELKRGGIIGAVDVTAVVRESQSKWFFGPRGLVLANPVPCDFIPSVGALGFFKWERNDNVKIDTPKWMSKNNDTISPQGELV